MPMMGSDRFQINQTELGKWLKNAAIFFAPAALLFVITIQAGGSFNEALIAIKLWGLNTLVDVLRKFIGDNSNKPV